MIISGLHEKNAREIILGGTVPQIHAPYSVCAIQFRVLSCPHVPVRHHEELVEGLGWMM